MAKLFGEAMKMLWIVLVCMPLLAREASSQSLPADTEAKKDSTMHSCGRVMRTDTFRDTTLFWYMIGNGHRADIALRTLDSTLIVVDQTYEFTFSRRYVVLEAKPVKSCPPAI